jgi:hypothetical protein
MTSCLLQQLPGDGRRIELREQAAPSVMYLPG